MKIAVTAVGRSLDTQVDPRFGRCPVFLIIDTDAMEVDAIDNPNPERGGGAGPRAGELMAEHQVQYVLTGNCGPKAHEVLSAAGIQLIAGCSGVVRDVIERFVSGGFGVMGVPAASGPGKRCAGSPSRQDGAPCPEAGSAGNRRGRSWEPGCGV